MGLKREGIPIERQSSEGPEVPRNVPPETASSRTVTTCARDRQQRRHAATEDRAGVDGTTATVPPASGRREPSGVHRDRRDGYRPTGADRAPSEASEVDLGNSEQTDVRPDHTGSNRIRPDQVKPTLNLPKLSQLTVTEYLTTVVIRR